MVKPERWLEVNGYKCWSHVTAENPITAEAIKLDGSLNEKTAGDGSSESTTMCSNYQIKRAIAVLKRTQRYHIYYNGEIQPDKNGNWIASQNLNTLLDILQEEHQL